MKNSFVEIIALEDNKIKLYAKKIKLLLNKELALELMKKLYICGQYFQLKN